MFDKPVIYADVSFDDSVYDAWWLDEEMWTFKALRRLGYQLREEDLENLKEMIGSCLDSDELKRQRQEVKEECWANISHSAASIAEYLISKREELTGGRES